MGVDHLPSVLNKVDLLQVFGLSISDFNDKDPLKVLRQKFLHKAKECHPDKQTSKSHTDSNEFAILKAAFDYLNKDNNLEKYIYRKQSFSDETRYKHVDTVLSAKQAYLKAQLDKKIKEFKETYSKEAKTVKPRHDDNARLKNYYNDILDSRNNTTNATENKLGELHVIVTATDKVKEISLLVKSSHFLELFNGFGVLSIYSIPNYSDTNPEIAKIIFNSLSNAVLALLYYRQHKSLFRNDLYSLAFISNDKFAHPTDNDKAKQNQQNYASHQTNAKRDISVKDIQGSILEKFKKRAMKKS